MQKASVLAHCMMCLLLLTSCAKAEDRRLIITAFEAPPYIYLDEADTPQGLLVKVVSAASTASGVPVEFRITVWPRAQLETQVGRADLIFPVVYTREREAWLDYPSTPITRFEMKIFAHKDAPFTFTGNPEQLHGLTIGKIARGRMHPNFRKLEDSGKARVEGRETVSELLRGTALKRLDAFVAPHLVAIWKANHLGITDVREFPDPIGVSDIYLTLSKNAANRDLWQKLRDHLPSLQNAEEQFIADMR
ncbi:ABC-type amino acid transport substrate-binding protein [Roseibium hamelinense]|uniref:ABC-type amino acid transport substrate-binding protein n=1 Tax=Roseibium hamelinense TaxID=150831 RepID=A0A562TI32_9HYPH|nr:transporter substrate-binding domain-containing protein [Roseibium hamelinense]MTI42613.1 transporter substrate-binding domain-containing protein [Roseibium hamelinense]TWI93359.1 ABC-type amino acid transport substrate-binding protein [Roseibium hamelinense]